MTVDTNRLRGEIVAHGMTQEAMAKAIGVDASTFIRKMKNDGLSFSIGQIHKMVDVLSISNEDACKIFFAN